MKRFLLLWLIVGPTLALAQLENTKSVNALSVPTLSVDSLRFDLIPGEVFKLDMRVKKTRVSWPKLVLAGVQPSLIPRPGPDRKLADKGFHLNLIAPIAAASQFFKPSPRLHVQVKHYDSLGYLIKTGYPKKAGKVFTYETISETRGHLVVSVTNLSKVGANAKVAITNAQTPTDTIPTGTDNPSTDSEAPFAWENYLGGVTITAPIAQQSHDFIATYEAWLGPSASWQAIGGGDGGGGGGGGGDGEYNPPSPEGKQKAKELEANKCEAAYVLEHLLDAPNMAQQLLYNKAATENYMKNSNMNAANIDGTSKENAVKHALISAMNYCLLGENHAKNIASFHETCDGKNMNNLAPELERTMDLYNNEKGFQIAKTVGCNADYAAIKTAIMYGYKHGTFHDINGNAIYAP